MYIFELLSSAGGAFFGAAAAFILNIFYSNYQTKLEYQNTLIVTKYVIEKILSVNKQYLDYIKKYGEDRNDKFFDWEKITIYESFFNLPEIETKNLLFLLKDQSQGKKILDSILLVSAEYETLKNATEKRNDLYSKYCDKTPDRENIQKGQLCARIGEKLFKELETYTNQQ